MMTPEEAVQNYQCPGCLYGPFPDCFKSGSDKDKACVKHSAGTVMPTVYIFRKREKSCFCERSFK